MSSVSCQCAKASLAKRLPSKAMGHKARVANEQSNALEANANPATLIYMVLE